MQSRGSYLKLLFKSNEKFHGTGFSATYRFRIINDPHALSKGSLEKGNKGNLNLD